MVRDVVRVRALVLLAQGDVVTGLILTKTPDCRFQRGLKERSGEKKEILIDIITLSLKQ